MKRFLKLCTVAALSLNLGLSSVQAQNTEGNSINVVDLRGEETSAQTQYLWKANVVDPNTNEVLRSFYYVSSNDWDVTLSQIKEALYTKGLDLELNAEKGSTIDRTVQAYHTTIGDIQAGYVEHNFILNHAENGMPINKTTDTVYDVVALPEVEQNPTQLFRVMIRDVYTREVLATYDYLVDMDPTQEPEKLAVDDFMAKHPDYEVASELYEASEVNTRSIQAYHTNLGEVQAYYGSYFIDVHRKGDKLPGYPVEKENSSSTVNASSEVESISSGNVAKSTTKEVISSSTSNGSSEETKSSEIKQEAQSVVSQSQITSTSTKATVQKNETESAEKDKKLPSTGEESNLLWVLFGGVSIIAVAVLVTHLYLEKMQYDMYREED